VFVPHHSLIEQQLFHIICLCVFAVSPHILYADCHQQYQRLLAIREVDARSASDALMQTASTYFDSAKRYIIQLKTPSNNNNDQRQSQVLLQQCLDSLVALVAAVHQTRNNLFHF